MKENTLITNSLSVIRSRFRLLHSNWISSTVNKFILLCFGASALVLLWRWNKLPPQIPLWYTRPWGPDQLAHPLWLWILPISAALLHILNILLSVFVLHEHRVFSQVLFLTSLLLSILSLAALTKIVLLIT